MTYQDIMLPLVSYPEPVPETLIDQAVAFSSHLGPNLDAVAVRISIPDVSNRIAEALVHLRELARFEEQKSRQSCEAMIQRFKTAATSAGVSGQSHIACASLYDVAERVAQLSRTRDLTIVPAPTGDPKAASLAEAVVFGSGRPVILLPQAAPPASPLLRVTIAWDGGRAAAKAVADALPLLRGAAQVRILVIANEKAATTPDIAAGLVRHLGTWSVQAQVDVIDAAGQRIGQALRRGLAEHPADLLVMGAFGHSRAREFILGGATQSLLNDTPLPVFFSH